MDQQLAWSREAQCILQSVRSMLCAASQQKERIVIIAMGKRANSEGSVYRRKDDGRWVASISLDNGKRKTIYCKTQREALKEVKKANQEKDAGMLLMTEEQTLTQFLTTWLEDKAQLNLRPRTSIRYRELITLHILPALGNTMLQKLMPQQLQRFYRSKLDAELALGTVKNLHRLLHHALNDALKWGLVVRNVCDVVDTPRVPRQERRVFTGEQARHFLETAQGDPLEALYVLALTTGMRQGELLALKWEDIDFVQGKVQVRRTIARVRRQGFKISEPKTPKSRRNILLTTLAIESLKRHRVRQHESRLQTGTAWDDQSWIFCNGIGRPIDPSALLIRSFRPLLVRAELPLIRFHDLRHSTASLLLSMGIHAKVVSELLGHSQITLTLDTYSHVLPSLQEEAISRLNTLLSKQG